MKKRFLSIVLAVLMLLSVMPVTAMAADRTTVNTAQNGIEATKTAKWVYKRRHRGNHHYGEGRAA